MHILIAGLYAGIIWLSLLAYTIILEGWWMVVVIAGPVIISALIVGLIALDELGARIGRWMRRAKPPDAQPKANIS